MKKLLVGLAAVPFLAGVALAAEPLSDAQMDRVTAGDLFTTCAGNPSCSTSSSADGTAGSLTISNFKDQFASLLAAYYAHLIAKGFPLNP